MEHYVTLFDKTFLPQGLCLYQSMDRNIDLFKLWVVCVDDSTYELLGKLDLPNIKRLRLSTLETPELAELKHTRSIAEYCWTLTPFAPRFVFEADNTINRVTYIDADLWFRKNPNQIFEEFESSGKEVLITDHGYAPECDLSATSGQFCVQFMTFNRAGGEMVRKWWEERCVEWCFSKYEDGKFGDQKYLDDWPARFPKTVHVLRDKELALAPWNASRFPYGNSIFYHFHGLRIASPRKFYLGNYDLPNTLMVNVYKPYCQELCQILDDLKAMSWEFKRQTETLNFLKNIYRFLRSKINKTLKILQGPFIKVRPKVKKIEQNLK